MRVYLDTCSLQRPLDTKSHVCIALEAEAVLGILALCESGEIELVSSDVLLFEIAHNPHPVRREYAFEALSVAREFIALSDSLQQAPGNYLLWLQTAGFAAPGSGRIRSSRVFLYL